MNLWVALGSLVAVLAVAGLVALMRFGDVALVDEGDALDHARALFPGFSPTIAILAEDRRSALVADGEGRVALLRQHGAHFAGRMPVRTIEPTTGGKGWTIATGDPRFGDWPFSPDADGRDKLLTIM